MAENTGAGALGVDDLDGAALCAAVGAHSRDNLQMAVRRYALAHQWCVAHPPVDDADAAIFGDARLPGASSSCDLRVGGEGTPGVRVHAVEAYAATAGLSISAGLQALSDALDLHHRLKQTWALVVALQVPAWVAARLAQETSHLSQNAANWIDDRLACTGRYGWKNITFVIKQAIATFHPEMLRSPEVGRDDWDVTVEHGNCAEGTSRLDTTGDSLDLEKFHDLICDEATTLGRLGDPDGFGQRKAKALGVLADRHASCQDSLDLSTGTPDGAAGGGTGGAPAGPASDGTGGAPAGPASDGTGGAPAGPASGRTSRAPEGAPGGNDSGTNDGAPSRPPVRSATPAPEDCGPDYAKDSLLAAMAAAAASAAAAPGSGAEAAGPGGEPSTPASRENASLAGILADARASAEAAHQAATAARAASVAAGFGDPTHPETGEHVPRARSYVRSTLYLHLSLDDLTRDMGPSGSAQTTRAARTSSTISSGGASRADGTDGASRMVVDAGRLGPQLLDHVKAWLAACGSDARIVPVVDLNREWAVDQHDPPDAMREQVVLRDEHCVFPWCTVDARSCDLDHIDAYKPDGPPGQTSPTKLACLCRRHHRLKTFSGWSYERQPDGSLVWTSPHRQRWRVVPGHGTTILDEVA